MKEFKGEKLSSLSAFFPAHNEETNLPKLLEDAMNVFSQVAEKFEIIIVDDGSTDNTKKILDDFKGKIPNLTAIHHEKNKGYGAAIRSGLSACKYEFIFFSDSDNQFDLSEISYLIPPIKDYDAVIGYRGKRKDPLVRTINAMGWKLVNRLILGVKARDINCAFKLLRRKHITDLDLISDGAMISAELLAYLQQKKLKIKEVEVSHYRRKSGEQSGANLKVIQKAFKELFIIRKSMKKFSRERP
ncbi:glycosyltransferase family 2 protein [bacterium]|nr:glycosyltransferase family 2 protein [bacterium]